MINSNCKKVTLIPKSLEVFSTCVFLLISSLHFPVAGGLFPSCFCSPSLECCSLWPPSLHFHLFLRFPPPLQAFLVFLYVDHSHHWLVVSFSYSFIKWIFRWCAVKYQYCQIYVHVCVYTRVGVYIIFASPENINYVWHRKYQEEKILFCTTLFSAVHHRFALWP